MNTEIIFGFKLTKNEIIINNIPRFVLNDNYTSAFGYQWNKYAKTQLDSYTKFPIAKNRLTRIVGGSLDIFKEKTVLEAGCGSGSFTEILLESKAKVFAVDLSSAVTSNYENCSKYPNYFICQADLTDLPIPPSQFDFVLCIRVIQHTPDPEFTIKKLISYLKPGGTLFIDHYSKNYPYTPSRKILRNLLLKQNKETSLKIVKIITNLLWGIHKIFYKYKNKSLINKIRYKFIYLSPIVDFQDAYYFLGEKLLYEWAVLATYDTLTDYYKHLRSPEDIEKYLKANAMTNIKINLAGNGIEASATKS